MRCADDADASFSLALLFQQPQQQQQPQQRRVRVNHQLPSRSHDIMHDQPAASTASAKYRATAVSWIRVSYVNILLFVTKYVTETIMAAARGV